jgi:two-component system response regulator AtoC
VQHDDRALETWLRRNGAVDVVTSLTAMLPGVATVLTDGEGRVLVWSAGAEHLFGWSAAEAEGATAPPGVVCDQPGVQRAFGTQVAVRRKDGSEVAVRHWSRCFQQTTGGGGIHVYALAEHPNHRDGPVEPLRPRVLPPESVEFHGLLTRDPAMMKVIQIVRNVAETDATVLVRGESGTGKELVANAIHAEGRRRSRPFVAVNCAAFTTSLLESELFGHVKGAFTGATTSRPGIFTQADGGTLFLDEVAELDLELQSKLLRVLQEQVFVPVGGTEPRKVDVRVIAATHRALREEVKAGRFREDLLYRLRVVPIFLPALRERRPDIELLLLELLRKYSERGPRRVSSVDPVVLRRLLDHDWPGNVRELQNVVEYAFAVGRGPVLTLDDLPPELRSAPDHAPVDTTAAQIQRAIAAAGGDLQAAARQLGVSRATFWRMRKRHGIQLEP